MVKLFMSDGCSGSTAIMEMVEGLHNAANLSLANCYKNREVLDDIARGAYDISQKGGGAQWKKDEQLPGIFQDLVKNTAEHGKPLLVKEQSDYVIRMKPLSDFVSQNGKATIFLRSNLFDLMLCDIKDGIGVSQNMGTCPSCGHFRGRSTGQNAMEEKITLKIDQLMSGLGQLSKAQEDRVKWMKQNFPVTTAPMSLMEDEVPLRSIITENEEAGQEWGILTSEDLFEFEHNKNGLRTSARAWQRMMNQIGSYIPYDVIYRFLNQRVGSRDAPKPHHAMIENLEEVKRAMHECHQHHEKRYCDALHRMLRL